MLHFSSLFNHSGRHFPATYKPSTTTNTKSESAKILTRKLPTDPKTNTRDGRRHTQHRSMYTLILLTMRLTAHRTAVQSEAMI